VAGRVNVPRQPATLLEPLAAYALWADSYPARAHNPLMRTEERAMLSLLPPDLSGRVVLDAGCGSGRYVLHALRRGAAEVVGVDLSPEMLQRARTELAAAPDAGRVKLLQASVADLPLADEFADVTICALTVGHLTSLEAALAELCRVTRAGGLILCSDFHPRAHSRGGRREFARSGQRYEVRHTTFLQADWRRACRALGLRILQILEPRLTAADLGAAPPPEPAVLEAPVVLVFELRRDALGAAG
jgi:malonyl-CoA O-methyltransferase